MAVKIVFLISLFVISVRTWNTCDQTFCGRLRQSPANTQVQYTLDLENIENVDGKLVTILKPNVSAAAALQFELSVLGEEIFHIFINETNTKTQRYRAKDALAENQLPVSPLEIVSQSADKVEAVFKTLKVVMYGNSTKLEFYNGGILFSVINPKQRFVFETIHANETGIGMDISFPGAQRAYGIPEHADHLALRNTQGEDPYRHFNLDYGSYRVESSEALYGSIGVLYAHSNSYSSGVFWLNAAETWIDILNGPNQVDAFFMSASGVLEAFVLAGPTFPNAVKQYSQLTGVAPLPQYFTLGYHQSRYSYMTEDEVKEVVQNFDTHNLPLDVMWLDIDYTDSKKYFTWDPERFSNPQELINNLTSTNRKLVAIIDPHIKVEDGYFLHGNATKNDYYVFDVTGTKPFEGDCWPGLSSYLDFLNPEALEYYSTLYSSHFFENKDVHVWNDMNEPAVFNVPLDENTMPLNATHHGGWKHRDVHNIYGFYQTVGTRKGLLARQPDIRPFILTRSHFAGTQRYAAMWTGDNRATWEYLKISFPMCLTEALGGISFCGADVGGFGGIPDDELYQRWYQAGAWLPFYRGHSAIDVPRREPYLYGVDIQNRVRKALQQRYAHLPVWYTLFYEHEQTGEPVIRPITYQYPLESDAFNIEDQILLGRDILAAPVLEKGVLQSSVYLPGGEEEVWYNIDDNYKALPGTGYHQLRVSLNSVPVFYRAGSIITRKDIAQPSSTDTHKDSYTAYVCVNKNGDAQGKLYVDDYETFAYKKQNKYLFVNFLFNNDTFTFVKINSNYEETAPITNLVIINPPQNITYAEIIVNGANPIDIYYNEDHTVLFVTNFTADFTRTFLIKLR